MAITNELVTEYSVTLKDQTLTVLNNLQTSFQKINTLATDFGKIFTGGQDITSFFKQFVSGANDIQNMSKATGISTKSIQEWTYAAKAFGVSADSILSDMKSLKASQAIGEKDLIRLSKTFSKSSAFYSQQLGQYLGMSQDMITVLRQGPAAIQKMLDEAHKMGAVLDDQKIKQAAEAQSNFNKSMAAFQGNAQQVIAQILPKLNEWLEKLNEFMANHPEKTLEYIGKALKVIIGMNVASWLIRTGTEFGKFFKIINNTQEATTKMGSAFSQMVTGMSKKTGALGAIGKSISGFGAILSKLTDIVKFFTAAWATWEISRGIGKLLGLDDENRVLGKWFAEAGEQAGDIFYGLYKMLGGGQGYDIRNLSPEELNRRRMDAGISVQPDYYENEKNENEEYGDDEIIEIPQPEDIQYVEPEEPKEEKTNIYDSLANTNQKLKELQECKFAENTEECFNRWKAKYDSDQPTQPLQQPQSQYTTNNNSESTNTTNNSTIIYNVSGDTTTGSVFSGT